MTRFLLLDIRRRALKVFLVGPLVGREAVGGTLAQVQVPRLLKAKNGKSAIQVV